MSQVDSKRAGQTDSGNQVSENTAQGAGIGTEEGIGRCLHKMVESRSLKRFWERLSRVGVGTNAIERRANKFEVEKLSKEGVNFNRRE